MKSSFPGFLTTLILPLVGISGHGSENPPPLPTGAELAFEETWVSGKIDASKWYPLRKQWGKGNHGVVPENVSVVRSETTDGQNRFVLRCEAHGDEYDGQVTGLWNRPDRVGGVLVSKPHFASGRFQVSMKIGSPENPAPPGIVPAIWTYGYRVVKVDEAVSDDFHPESPLYHPYLQNWGKGLAFYWSEIDFPEYGKAGNYGTPMYNTFLNKQHDSRTFDVRGAADGKWHTYTTDWRTELVPVEGVSDDQVVEAEGYFWIRDKAIPFDQYWGNPLKKVAKDRYAVYTGKIARHYIDGIFVGENTKWVPAMTGQLNLGVWLPDWAGPAPWEKVAVHFGDIRVWQFHDSGDVRGVLIDDITDSFDRDGNPVAQ